MKREILEGQFFGKWEVISYEGCVNHKKSFYKCRCTGCGAERSVRADKLKAGRSTQCTECSRAMRRAAKEAKQTADEKDAN